MGEVAPVPPADPHTATVPSSAAAAYLPGPRTATSRRRGGCPPEEAEGWTRTSRVLPEPPSLTRTVPSLLAVTILPRSGSYATDRMGPS